jgi:hypothetical protein
VGAALLVVHEVPEVLHGHGVAADEEGAQTRVDQFGHHRGSHGVVGFAVAHQAILGADPHHHHVALDHGAGAQGDGNPLQVEGERESSHLDDSHGAPPPVARGVSVDLPVTSPEQITGIVVRKAVSIARSVLGKSGPVRPNILWRHLRWRDETVVLLVDDRHAVGTLLERKNSY